MGRIKEISRKSAHTRKRNPVVYLICEGSETEIRYFKRFRSRGCNIDIIPISSQYKSADKLVQKLSIVVGAFSVAKMRPMITGLGIVYSSSKQMQKHFRTHILTFDIGFCQKDWI